MAKSNNFIISSFLLDLKVQNLKRIRWSFYFFIFLMSFSCRPEEIPDQFYNPSKFIVRIGGLDLDYSNDIIVTSDSNYVIYGVKFLGNPQPHPFPYFVKIHKEDGKILINETCNIMEFTDLGHYIVQTPEGYLGTGAPESAIPIFLFDRDGKCLSLTKINLSSVNYYNPFVKGLVQINKNEYLVALNIQNINGQKGLCSVRINSKGEPLYNYIVSSFQYGDYDINKIIKLNDDSVLIVGSINGYSKAFAMKLNPDGQKVWEYISPLEMHNVAFSALELSNGEIILVGEVTTPPNNLDFLLIRLNHLGGKIGEPLITGGANVDQLLRIAPTKDGHFIVMGKSKSFNGQPSVYLSKRNALTNASLWEKHILPGISENYAVDFESTPDGGCITLVAETNTINPSLIIIKTDANGNYK